LSLQLRRAHLLSRYRATVVASRFMEAEFRRHGVSRVVRIPLFVPELPQAPETRAEEGPLVFVGRLVSNKGPEVMLRALGILSARGIQARLVLRGDGSQRHYLERLAASLALQAEFRGWVPAAERDKVLRTAKLLLVPSILPEPFGLVGLEAGRLGVPAVAF